MKILLVDDETELIEALGRVLRQEGYQVDTAPDGVQGLALALQGHYNLVILDWMLPGQSGLDICQKLRSQDDTLPVLFLTAKDTLDDRVLGLDAGADDYLMKPFELRELLARVRALLRRSAQGGGGKLQQYQVELDPDNQLAYRGGKVIRLSDREMNLLTYLMQHPNQVLDHEQIHRHLWGEGDPPNSNVLAALVRLLRRKIDIPGEPPLIHSVYGRGYRFGDPPT